jgi:hypothetical protein
VLDIDAVLNAFGGSIGDDEDLMRCAPDAQHVVLSARDNAGDDVTALVG